MDPKTKKMLEKLLDADKLKKNRKLDQDKGNKIEDLLKHFAKSADDEDDIDAKIRQAIEDTVGGKVAMVPVTSDNADKVLELLAHLANNIKDDDNDNSKALVTNVESLIGAVYERINELREAMQSLSYTNPDGHEYISQCRIRLGSQGVEFAVDEEKAEELDIVDWVKENVRTPQEDDDD